MVAMKSEAKMGAEKQRQALSLCPAVKFAPPAASSRQKV